MSAAAQRADASICHWSSTLGDGSTIAELSKSHVDSESLASTLSAIATELADCVALIVHLKPATADDLYAAMATAEAARLPVRVCLAIEREALARIDSSKRGDERVGLLLDNVDAQTPLGDIANDAIEAIRFGPAFSKQATQNLRSECILDAMLGFARNIGAVTFGSALRTGETWLAPEFEFDYVPVSSNKSANAPGSLLLNRTVQRAAWAAEFNR